MDIDEPETSQTGRPLRGGLTPEASRMFRVYKTMSAMLSKRGYMVPREMREMTPATFTTKFGEYPTRESLTILVVSIDSIILSLLLSVFSTTGDLQIIQILPTHL